LPLERYLAMTRQITGGLLACSLALLGAAPALAQDRIAGTYLDSGGFVEITVNPCGDALCGEITRIVKRKPGEPDRDVHNDDPALRDRPLVGVRILQDLRWDNGAWRGEVYNPEDGGTYRAVVRRGENGTLRVQGCLAFLCRTRVWPRV
jgi:uncharacterized protein (DUF2147 family)